MAATEVLLFAWLQQKSSKEESRVFIEPRTSAVVIIRVLQRQALEACSVLA